VWTQPGRLTKNGDPHRLRLHPLALELLRGRRSDAGEPARGLVFPAPRAGKALDTFDDMKAAVGAKAGLSDWRWHDFRRSFATALGEAGVDEAVVDAVLNHRQAATRGGVLGVYQLAQRWPEQAKAMEAWGAILAAAIAGQEPDARVVRLPVAATA
jgi:integrase